MIELLQSHTSWAAAKRSNWLLHCVVEYASSTVAMMLNTLWSLRLRIAESAQPARQLTGSALREKTTYCCPMFSLIRTGSIAYFSS